MLIKTPGSFLIATFAASIGVLASYFYFTAPTRKKKPKLQGMVNLGNTCFANALLQCFAGSSSLASWFRNSKQKINSNLLSELSLVVDTLNNNAVVEADKDDQEISARTVIEALEKSCWKIDYHVQHDLYELLNVFITTWDEELTEYNCSKQKILSLLDVYNISQQTNFDDKEIKGVQLLQLLADNLLAKADQRPPCTGLLAIQFVCTSCGYKHVRHDRFCTLSLSLPKIAVRSCLTIDDCLRKYFATEKLYNVTCDKCKEKSTNPAIGKSNFYKNVGFSKLPECLIVHLDRVNWMPNGLAYKQDDFVQFDEYLDISNYLFYANRLQNDSLQRAVIVGGKCAPLYHSLYSFERGDGSTSRLGYLHAMSRNVGGLQQHPTVLMCNQSANETLPLCASSPTSQISNKNVSRNKYKLKAVAAHLGHTHDYGHFIAYRRGNPPSDDHNWYFTSDTDVRKVNFETEVQRCQAYMLFYERIIKS